MYKVQVILGETRPLVYWAEVCLPARSPYYGAPCLLANTLLLLLQLTYSRDGGHVTPTSCSSLHRLLQITSQSELYYDRRSVGQSVLEQNTHLGLTTRFLLLSDHCGFLLWGALSDERTGLSFTMYNVQYTIYFTFSDLRPGPCIYIPQEQDGPVIPPGT
jgi:hypothetical protein